MNKELKKYVNAYMDGEPVEFGWGEDGIWHTLESLSSFETDADKYRIKPKEDKWQRVIDEGYLCRFWDKEEDMDTGITSFSRNIGYLVEAQIETGTFVDTQSRVWDNCEVYRKKKNLQPYFQGEDIPEIDSELLVYFKDGSFELRESADSGGWAGVIAFIEV